MPILTLNRLADARHTYNYHPYHKQSKGKAASNTKSEYQTVMGTLDASLQGTLPTWRTSATSAGVTLTEDEMLVMLGALIDERLAV